MLRPLKPIELLNILKRIGFLVDRQKGSHIVLKREKSTIILPFHGSKDVPIPIIKSILKQGGLSESDIN